MSQKALPLGHPFLPAPHRPGDLCGHWLYLNIWCNRPPAEHEQTAEKDHVCNPLTYPDCCYPTTTEPEIEPEATPDTSKPAPEIVAGIVKIEPLCGKRCCIDPLLDRCACECHDLRVAPMNGALYSCNKCGFVGRIKDTHKSRERGMHPNCNYLATPSPEGGAKPAEGPDRLWKILEDVAKEVESWPEWKRSSELNARMKARKPTPPTPEKTSGEEDWTARTSDEYLIQEWKARAESAEARLRECEEKLAETQKSHGEMRRELGAAEAKLAAAEANPENAGCYVCGKRGAENRQTFFLCAQHSDPLIRYKELALNAEYRLTTANGLLREAAFIWCAQSDEERAVLARIEAHLAPPAPEKL